MGLGAVLLEGCEASRLVVVEVELDVRSAFLTLLQLPSNIVGLALKVPGLEVVSSKNLWVVECTYKLACCHL